MLRTSIFAACLIATTAFASLPAQAQGPSFNCRYANRPDEVRSHLDGTRTMLADLIDEHLPEIGYTPPEGTYLAWLDGRSLGLGDHPAEFFLEHAGVALTDGPESGDVGAGFMRYNFATPRAIVEQTVTQMADALRRTRRR